MREIRMQAKAILEDTSEPTFYAWMFALNFLADNHNRVDTYIKRMLFNRCEWYRKYFNSPRKKIVRIARNSGEMQIMEIILQPEDIKKEDVYPNPYHLFPDTK
jgi:hypothetical protein